MWQAGLIACGCPNHHPSKETGLDFEEKRGTDLKTCWYSVKIFIIYIYISEIKLMIALAG